MTGSPLPWSYHRKPSETTPGHRDWIEDANGNIVVEHVGHIDGPAICVAVNRSTLIEPAPAPVSGEWVMMPREPTKAMIIAAARNVGDHQDDHRRSRRRKPSRTARRRLGQPARGGERQPGGGVMDALRIPHPHLVEAFWWKREYWRAQERFEGAGGDRGWGNSLVTELTLRDAETERDFARSKYRDHLQAAWVDWLIARAERRGTTISNIINALQRPWPTPVTCPTKLGLISAAQTALEAA